MKIFTIDSQKLFNEHGAIIGEMTSDFLISTKERLKVANDFYKIKNLGFLLNRSIKIIDNLGKTVILIDSEKNRIFFYTENHTEIYYFKTKGIFESSTTLYRFENDEPMLVFKYKTAFFKTKYMVGVANNFNNPLLTLAFVYYLKSAYEN